MRYNYDLYESLIVVDRRLTKKVFLQKAGIMSGKYAENMFSRLYDWLFSEAIYVEDDYESYYKIEYSNFREFLNKKYSIPEKDLEKLLSTKEENENYTIIFVDELAIGESGFIDFAFSDELYERIINLLLMKN